MVKIAFNQELFDLHYDVLKKELQVLITQICSNKKIVKKRKKSDGKFENYDYLSLSKSDINYIQTLNLDMLLKAKFLKEITDELGKPTKGSNRYKLLFYIFVEKGYEKFFSQGKNLQNYSAYGFVEKLGLKSCPYCNRNYTFVVRRGKLRPEIDHFFPKTVYPYLAVNFFNLIPSCQTCNKTKTNDVNFDWLNPYDIKKDSFNFTYQPNSIDFVAVEKEKYNFNSFEIKINGHEENIKTFKLKELYEQHKDIVLELLIKKAYYPKSYIEELVGFGFSKSEIYRYLLGNYSDDKDLHKRPLSKLIKDISEELELI